MWGFHRSAVSVLLCIGNGAKLPVKIGEIEGGDGWVAQGS